MRGVSRRARRYALALEAKPWFSALSLAIAGASERRNPYFPRYFVLCVDSVFAFKYLNSLNPFPLEIAKLFSKFEIGLFYADIILSGVVLLVGVLQFMWDVIWKRD